MNFLSKNRYLFLILLGIICILFVYARVMLSPVSSQDEGREVVVAVPINSSANQVGEILKQNDLVRSPGFFTYYARLTGMDSQIKAGQYKLNSSFSTKELLNELVAGRLAQQSFTVPEGYTTAQIADLLNSKGLADKKDFLKAVSAAEFDYPFLKDLPAGEKRLEGYLFPDTYQVASDSTPVSIIDMMLERFAREMDELDYAAQAGRSGVTLQEAVIIASLIEREALMDEERPLIAGVIYNRLKIDMPLQIDATVQYALGTTKPELSYQDLEIESPYNTYMIYGLPPGPIAMPGHKSLLAAVRPTDTEYLYYVVNPDGSHAFAATLEEHEANMEMYE